MAAEDSEIAGWSHLKADNGYGRNGFSGPSSDMPGEHTTSGFLPEVKLPAEGADHQTRSVSKEQYPTTFGMCSPKPAAKIGTSNLRQPNEPRTGTHFQR